MEPRIVDNLNQYTVGERGQFVDVTTNRLVEGEIYSVIDDRLGMSESVYLSIRTERGIRTIKVV